MKPYSKEKGIEYVKAMFGYTRSYVASLYSLERPRINLEAEDVYVQLNSGEGEEIFTITVKVKPGVMDQELQVRVVQRLKDMLTELELSE